MRRISVPTADAIIAVNKLVCEEGGTPHHCNDKGKYGYPADLSSDGKFIILGSENGLVGLENAENGTEVKIFRKGEQYVRGLAFSLNGKNFASTGFDGKIWLWNIQETAPIKIFFTAEKSD